MTEYQLQRLAVTNGPDIHFDGRVIGEYSTQNRAGTKDRWTELRLWETPAGNWVAEMVGCSRHEREGELRTARVVSALLDQPERIREVMTVFDWTPAAKALARQLGWNVIERVA